MSTQHNERSILTEATFRITNHDGENVEVRRDLLIWENVDAEWSIAVSEPNPDDLEGDALSAASIPVPDEAASAFDELFALIADPARLGAGTR